MNTNTRVCLALLCWLLSLVACTPEKKEERTEVEEHRSRLEKVPVEVLSGIGDVHDRVFATGLEQEEESGDSAQPASSGNEESQDAAEENFAGGPDEPEVLEGGGDLIVEHVFHDPEAAEQTEESSADALPATSGGETDPPSIEGPTRPSPLDPRSSMKTVQIVFLGNVLSRLEPCGCQEAQNGGIARVVTKIKELREQYPHTVVCTVGRIFEGNSEVDEERALTLVTALGLAGIDVFNVTPDALLYESYLLKCIVERTGAKLVSNSLEFLQPDKQVVRIQRDLTLNFGDDGIPGFVFSGVGGDAPMVNRAVRTMGASRMDAGSFSVFSPAAYGLRYNSHPELFAGAPEYFKVLLSDFEDGGLTARYFENADLVLSARFPASRDQMEEALMTGDPDAIFSLVPPNANVAMNEGTQVLSRALITFEGDSRKIEFSAVTIEPTIPEEPRARRLVDGYYRAVSRNPELMDVPPHGLSALAIEKLEGNSYRGNDSCGTCHESAAEQHEATKHHDSMHSLLKADRSYIPECLSCHTTGYGSASGYALTNRNPSLATVGCETCHGPGALHEADTTNKNLVRRGNDDELCKTCHTPVQDPTFDRLLAERFASVRH
ncbi:MAG: hypothetical protein NUW37_02935 [Planctomycetes bacterium]|nr:hypothetical protein [Planctomycetota bacterium]